MSPKWLIGLGVIFVIFTIYCNVLEYVDPLSGDTAGPLERAVSYSQMQLTGSIGDVQTILSTTGDTIGGIWDMLWFNYNFLEETFIGRMFQYFCWALTLGIMFSIVVVLVQMVRGS